jgi:hypothetical protein
MPGWTGAEAGGGTRHQAECADHPVVSVSSAGQGQVRDRGCSWQSLGRRAAKFKWPIAMLKTGGSQLGRGTGTHMAHGAMSRDRRLVVVTFRDGRSLAVGGASRCCLVRLGHWCCSKDCGSLRIFLQTFVDSTQTAKGPTKE